MNRAQVEAKRIFLPRALPTIRMLYDPWAYPRGIIIPNYQQIFVPLLRIEPRAFVRKKNQSKLSKI